MNIRIPTILLFLLTIMSARAEVKINQHYLDSITAEGDSLLAQVMSGEATKFDYLFMEAIIERQKGNSTGAFDLLRYCAELNPQSAETHYYLAQYYLDLKDTKRAMKHFTKATELAPDNVIYLEMLARVYISQKDYIAAIPVVEKMVKKETDRTDMLELLCQLYEQQEDYDNAIKSIDRLEVLTGKNERLTLRKSRIYAAMGDSKSSLAEIKKLADEYPNDPNYRCIYAEALLDNGMEKEAVDILGDVLKEDSLNTRALVTMYAINVDKNERKESKRFLERLLLSDKATDDIKMRLMQEEIAISERTDRDSTVVLRYFDRMMAQPKPSADIALFYASYMIHKKMPTEEVSKVLEQILEMAPDNASARLQLLGYAWQKNDMHRVIALCADARRYNPDNMLFYYYQGLAYYRIGDRENALGALQNGIDVIADDSDAEMVSDFYSIMGDLLYDKKEYDRAFAAYDSCLQWKPDNIGCLNNYAYFLSVVNRSLDKAEQMSAKAIKAEPENATYLDTYAWILFLQERYAEAKVYIDQAVANDKAASSVILEHAGDIHAMNGDITRALELWKEAAVKDSKNETLKKKIKKKKYIKK